MLFLFNVFKMDLNWGGGLLKKDIRKDIFLKIMLCMYIFVSILIIFCCDIRENEMNFMKYM